MRLLFASDLHGDRSLYEALIDYSARQQPNWLLLGGDLLPKTNDNVDILLDQQQFLTGPFRQFLTRLKAYAPDTKIVTILGNDDCGTLIPLLNGMKREAPMYTAHNRMISLGDGWMLFGFHLVPETPFVLKDHERLDQNDSLVRYPGVGVRSGEEGLSKVRAEEWFNSLPSLATELFQVKGYSDTNRSILLSHAPPWGTPLDQMENGKHVGSRAIYNFIKRYKPRLGFHGHIHESFHESGQYWCQLGDTVCFNPGQIHQPGLDAVVVEINNNVTKVFHKYLGSKGRPTEIGKQRLKAPLSWNT